MAWGSDREGLASNRGLARGGPESLHQVRAINPVHKGTINNPPIAASCISQAVETGDGLYGGKSLGEQQWVVVGIAAKVKNNTDGAISRMRITVLTTSAASRGHPHLKAAPLIANRILITRMT